jgi:cell division protein FtsL
MKKIFITILAVAILVLSGCASIISGTNKTLTFNSDIEGVNVYIDGALIGKTPISASFKKNKAQSTNGYVQKKRLQDNY